MKLLRLGSWSSQLPKRVGTKIFLHFVLVSSKWNFWDLVVGQARCQKEIYGEYLPVFSVHCSDSLFVLLMKLKLEGKSTHKEMGQKSFSILLQCSQWDLKEGQARKSWDENLSALCPIAPASCQKELGPKSFSILLQCSQWNLKEGQARKSWDENLSALCPSTCSK